MLTTAIAFMGARASAAASTGFHFLGDSMLDHGAADSTSLAVAVMARMNNNVDFSVQQQGGATLTQEVGWYLGASQYWGKKLILDDALGTTDGTVTQVTQAWNAQRTGEHIYIHPSIWETITDGSADRITINSIISTIQSTYPNDFFDTIPIAILYGTGSTKDSADITGLVWPSSLRVDGVHVITPTGQNFHADMVASAIIARGWDGVRAPQNKRLPVVTRSSNTLSVFPGIWFAYPSPSTLTITYSGVTCVYPVPTYTYQWYRNGSAIGGATSSTLDVSAAPADSQYTVTVTATNSQGSAAATSAGFWVNRTAVSAYSSATNTLINSMTVRPSGAQATAIDTAMTTIQSLSGVLDWFIAPLHDEQASRINWLDGTTIATPYNGVTFTPGRGWTTPYAFGGIRPWYIPGSGKMTQNSAHYGIYIESAASDNTAAAVSMTSSSNCYLAPRVYGATGCLVKINNITQVVTSATVGHWVPNLSGGTAFSVFKNSAEIGVATVSNPSVAATDIAVAHSAAWDGILGAFHCGSALTLAQATQLNTVILNLRTAFS